MYGWQVYFYHITFRIVFLNKNAKPETYIFLNTHGNNYIIVVNKTYKTHGSKIAKLKYSYRNILLHVSLCWNIIEFTKVFVY